MNTALQVYEKHGDKMADLIAQRAQDQARQILRDAPISVDITVINRKGDVIAQAL